MTPTPDQANRSHTRKWLAKHAPPSALRDIYKSLATADSVTCSEDQYLNRKMIADVYFLLTNQEIED